VSSNRETEKLPPEELKQVIGGVTSPSSLGDITSGIVDSYKNSAEQFDIAVNKMITDAATTSGGSSTPNAAASTVNTSALTTDGMVVQAKQSVRDTIGGAASTVFKTIQKLAQQLGQ